MLVRWRSVQNARRKTAQRVAIASLGSCSPVRNISPSRSAEILTKWIGYSTFRVIACGCQALPCVLVSNGFFPTSPHAPRMAVSVELLDLLLAVSERSSDAVTALSTALNNSY